MSVPISFLKRFAIQDSNTSSMRAPFAPADASGETQGRDPVLILMGFGVFPECYGTGETDPILHLKTFGVFPEAYNCRIRKRANGADAIRSAAGTPQS